MTEGELKVAILQKLFYQLKIPKVYIGTITGVPNVKLDFQDLGST